MILLKKSFRATCYLLKQSYKQSFPLISCKLARRDGFQEVRVTQQKKPEKRTQKNNNSESNFDNVLNISTLHFLFPHSRTILMNSVKQCQCLMGCPNIAEQRETSAQVEKYATYIQKNKKQFDFHLNHIKCIQG